MKNALALLVLLAFLSPAKAQNVTFPVQNGNIIFEKVVHVDSLTKKEQLFSQVQSWFAKAYNNSNGVVKLSDAEDGHIIGKGRELLFIGINNPTYLTYTIEVYVKDGRYKYRIYDLILSGQYYGNLDSVYQNYLTHNYKKMLLESDKAANKRYELILKTSKFKIENILLSLTNYLSSPVVANNF